MTKALDFKQLIEIGDQYAQVSFLYKGPPSSGMIAWLDSTEMKIWWKADNVIIEPWPGGMFYIVWAENEESSQHAIYGVMETLDTEKNRIEISKIFYMSPLGKMGPLHLEIRLEDAGQGLSRFWLRHTHRHDGQLQKLYKAAVYASWPQTFGLLLKHLEKDQKQMRK
jgi:hypothetical protein